MGCNTHLRGNNPRNLSVQLSASETSQIAMVFLLAHIFSSTKSEIKMAEQGLPGSGGRGGGPHNVCTCR
jgi:hypothetical protein